MQYDSSENDNSLINVKRVKTVDIATRTSTCSLLSKQIKHLLHWPYATKSATKALRDVLEQKREMQSHGC